jgi:hypothetical protein
MVDDDDDNDHNDDHQDNDNHDDDDNNDERSEVSIEFNFEADIMSSITSTLYPIENSTYSYESFIFDENFLLNIESIVTADQSSKKRHVQFSCDPETIIDGHTLRWPKFEVNDCFFEGN